MFYLVGASRPFAFMAHRVKTYIHDLRLLNLLREFRSHKRWQLRFILWTSSAVTGAIIAGFAMLSEHAQHVFQLATHWHGIFAWLLPICIPMLAIWLTQRYFPGSQGSGIPQAIAAIHLINHDKPVSQLVSLRIAIGKVFVGALGLMGGISAGREGPSVQVAASLMHAIHRLLPSSKAIKPQDLILAGSAAGIAAAFNTPLAGLVFAVEEMGKQLESRTSGILLSTIILSGLMAISLVGNYSYFGSLHIESIQLSIIWPIILCGVANGLLGGLFSKALLWPQQYARATVWQWRKTHPVYFAGLCGLLLAILGWLSQGSSFGNGYLATTHLLNGTGELSWYAPILRAIATLATYFMGIPGGIFAPSLAIGAGIGNDAAFVVFQNMHAHIIIALCMAGFLAAVTQAPITSAIIMMEMIDNHGMVMSLMATCMIARFVSSRLGPALYHQLAKGFINTNKTTPIESKIDPNLPQS